MHQTLQPHHISSALLPWKSSYNEHKRHNAFHFLYLLIISLDLSEKNA